MGSGELTLDLASIRYSMWDPASLRLVWQVFAILCGSRRVNAWFGKYSLFCVVVGELTLGLASRYQVTVVPNAVFCLFV